MSVSCLAAQRVDIYRQRRILGPASSRREPRASSDADGESEVEQLVVDARRAPPAIVVGPPAIQPARLGIHERALLSSRVSCTASIARTPRANVASLEHVEM